MSMKYNVKSDKIQLIFPAKNAGRFRFKTREQSKGYGDSFSTRTLNFNDDVYLEWQIGYDVRASEIEAGKKETKLDNESFVGSNGKKKYPYELSELVYESVSSNLKSIEDLKGLLREIHNYEELITSRAIKVEEVEEVKLNSLSFKESIIKLPTFFMLDTEDDTQIEVSIEKQQYAAGVQPMIYFIIPFTSFVNHGKFKSRSSQKGETLIYELKNSNIGVLFDLFRVFGMASEAHKKDVEEIIETLISLIKDQG